MATTLADINALSTDITFQTKVRAGIVYVAVEIIKDTDEMAEEITPLDKSRRALAVRVIENRDLYADQFAWILATVPSITQVSNDAALITTINSAWNYLANLSY